jgi:hypothetical protein
VCEAGADECAGGLWPVRSAALVSCPSSAGQAGSRVVMRVGLACNAIRPHPLRRLRTLLELAGCRSKQRRTVCGKACCTAPPYHLLGPRVCLAAPGLSCCFARHLPNCHAARPATVLPRHAGQEAASPAAADGGSPHGTGQAQGRDAGGRRGGGSSQQGHAHPRAHPPGTPAVSGAAHLPRRPAACSWYASLTVHNKSRALAATEQGRSDARHRTVTWQTIYGLSTAVAVLKAFISQRIDMAGSTVR